MTQENYEEIQAAHEAQETMLPLEKGDDPEYQWCLLSKQELCEIKGCRKPCVKMLKDPELGVEVSLCWEHFHKAYTALEHFRMARIRLVEKQKKLFISNLGA